MPHSSMEYAIMVPVLLVQVILIPAATAWIIDVWTVKRKENALQDIANHVGSTIQQLYFSLNRDDVTPGTTLQSANFPLDVENIPFTIIAFSKKVENTTILDLQLALTGTEVTTTSRVTLGPNTLWKDSTFSSNSTDPGIGVVKFSNGTLQFSFEQEV